MQKLRQITQVHSSNNASAKIQIISYIQKNLYIFLTKKHDFSQKTGKKSSKISNRNEKLRFFETFICKNHKKYLPLTAFY